MENQPDPYAETKKEIEKTYKRNNGISNGFFFLGLVSSLYMMGRGTINYVNDRENPNYTFNSSEYRQIVNKIDSLEQITGINWKIINSIKDLDSLSQNLRISGNINTFYDRKDGQKALSKIEKENLNNHPSKTGGIQ